MKETRKGMLLVISGPSGAGKGTLVSKLLDHDPSFSFSVSVTTRQKRDYEIEGVHYFFISEDLRANLKDAFILSEITGSDHCPVGIDIEI